MTDTDKLTSTDPDRDHFARLVAQWSHFGPPLRPSPADSAALQDVIGSLGPVPRVLVLGLTPEIVACRWPDGTALSAVDHSPAMIRALWPPGQGPAGATVLEADWCHIPVADASADLVAGDGCYIAFSHPQGYDQLSREIARVLKPGGRFAIRVFLRPDSAESLDAISAAFARGEIGSVHALKLRLLAVLHGASGPGTRLDDVWQAWRSFPPLPAQLAGTRGWSTDEITGIDGYRGLEARYYLPTLAEFRASLALGFGGTETACVHGDYELAARCPTLVFRRGAP